MTIEWFEGSREELADLFALADESSAAVASYRDLGRVLVARDGPALVGQQLVNRAIDVCRDEEIATLILSTSPADARTLHFYQRLGFRLERVVRDVFRREAGYAYVEIDGVPVRDQVWLSFDLRDLERRSPS